MGLAAAAWDCPRVGLSAWGGRALAKGLGSWGHCQGFGFSGVAADGRTH